MLWIDKLRIFPRIILVLYMIAMGVTLQWYLDFDIQYQTSCDSNSLSVLLDNNTPLDKAERIACTTISAVGRPAGYTALVSVLVGAGTGVFGLYVNSGGKRREEHE